MKELIQSKDVREYVEKIGYEFSDLEKAVLILNSGQSLIKQNQALVELARTTDDQRLKEKIQKEIAYDNLCIQQVQTPAADELYMIEVPDEDDSDDYKFREYFTNFNDALDCALESGRDFYIYKIKVHRGKTKWDEDVMDDGAVGYVRYKHGELYYYWLNSEDNENIDVETEYDEEYDIGCMEIPIPHPFKKGDMIRVVDTSDYGIVVFDYENDLCEVEGVGPVYKSESITVELVDEDALFSHAHITPDKLEYANLPDKDPLEELLQSAVYLYEGAGYIQAFQMECEKYVAWMKKNAL